MLKEKSEREIRVQTSRSRVIIDKGKQTSSSVASGDRGGLHGEELPKLVELLLETGSETYVVGYHHVLIVVLARLFGLGLGLGSGSGLGLGLGVELELGLGLGSGLGLVLVLGLGLGFGSGWVMTSTCLVQLKLPLRRTTPSKIANCTHACIERSARRVHAACSPAGASARAGGGSFTPCPFTLPRTL